MGDRDSGLRRASAVTLGLAAASVAGVLAVAVGVAVDRAHAASAGTGPPQVSGGNADDGAGQSGTGSDQSTGWPSIFGGSGRQHASSGGS